MTYRGCVQNGVVVLDEPSGLADGTVVSVRPVSKRSADRKSPKELPTLYERLKPIIGMANDLPADFSTNHDHYLYGTPKK